MYRYIMVMSQHKAEMVAETHLGKNAHYISITGCSENRANLGRIPEGNILRLSFDDVDSGDTAMTLAQAQQVVQFVTENDIDLLIIHCGAGRSRSAGVAAAIMDHFNREGDVIFQRYTPNMHCYRMVMNAFNPN